MTYRILDNGEERDATPAEISEIEAHWTSRPQAFAVLTARQFFIQLAVSEIITPEEALAAATVGTVPAAIDAVFATLPTAQALAARITWAKMTEVPRDDPLFAVVGPAMGLSSEFIDAFFIAAAAIP